MKNQVKNSQILYTSEFYTDNDGYHSAATYWTGDKVDSFGYANGYDNLTHDEYQAEADLETVEKAIEWYKKQPARGTAVGQIYKVKGSRKVKKGTVVTVIKVYDDYVATVEDAEGNKNHISFNCLDELVQNIVPNAVVERHYALTHP